MYEKQTVNHWRIYKGRCGGLDPPRPEIWLRVGSVEIHVGDPETRRPSTDTKVILLGGRGRCA